MNVAPKALQIGGKMEAIFFFRLPLKSTCPDAFRNDAFVLSTLYVYKESIIYIYNLNWILIKTIEKCV